MRRILTAIILAGAAVVALALPAAAAGEPPVPPGPPPPACVGHTYAEGTTGSCVTWIQQATNAINYSANWHQPVTVDGNYGPVTRSAITALQAGCNALEGFKPGSVGYMSGGMVGSNTWLALISHCYTPEY